MDGSASTDQLDRPLVFAVTNMLIGDVRLTEAVAPIYELTLAKRGAPLGDQIRALPTPPAVIVTPVPRDEASMCSLLRELRSSARGRAIPMLGITSFSRLAIDLAVLRSYGVVGLVDPESPATAFIDRLDRLVGRSSGDARVAERVDCFLPLLAEYREETTEECGLNLSGTGMRLTSSQSVELNGEVGLRFRLPMVSTEELAIQGRIVRVLPKLNSAGRREVAVFFCSISEESRKWIELEVGRLLSGDDGPAWSRAS